MKNIFNQDRIKELENKQLLYLLEQLGGWPVLERNWDESKWTWERSLLLLHRFVGVGEKTNIYRKGIPDGLEDEVDDGIQGITSDASQDDENELVTKYPPYMYEVAILLGAPDSDATKRELNEALQLGLALNSLLYGKRFKRTSKLKNAEVKELSLQLDLLRWMEMFDDFQLASAPSSIVDTSKSVYDNLKNLNEKFSKRAFANFILWRFIDFSTRFLANNLLDKTFNFQQQTFGVVDKEQRWKLCTRMTNTYAALASGSLYIREYFPEKSRIAAIAMVNQIIEEFKRTIKESPWMDDATKNGALNEVGGLNVFIGYDERLLDISKVERYYGKPAKDFSDSFFNLALQLNVHKTDKAFNHRYRNITDWTEYARPTTSKASYNKKDNSICKA